MNESKLESRNLKISPPRSPDLNLQSLVANLQSGDPLFVARAITRVERGGTPARELIQEIFPLTGRADLIGVTGAPGTGKSTLVNALAKEFTARGDRVAILAVDPSSPFTGGAILGDRFRMQDLQGTGVFIRSMASRGQLGGLAAAVSDATLVLDAANFDVILIETVGAGQGEVDIARYAHTTLVLEAPGFGDDIQAIKAGILEIADILVVNKADRDGANATAAALEMNLNLNPDRAAWRPPVLQTVALTGKGVTELVDAIAAHQDHIREHNLRREQETARFRDRLHELLKTELLQNTLSCYPAARWDAWLSEITERKRDVYTVVSEILDNKNNA